MHWFMHSVWLLVCRWKAVESLSFIPRWEVSSFQKREVKTGSQSETILEGRPWSLKMVEMKNCARPEASSNLTVGMKWACLDKQCVENMRRWEISDEIHWDRIPVTGRNLKRNEVTIGSMVRGFVTLAQVTAVHVTADVIGKTWPGVISGKQFYHFCTSWKAGERRVMIMKKDFCM